MKKKTTTKKTPATSKALKKNIQSLYQIACFIVGMYEGMSNKAFKMPVKFKTK
jgi:hypothetical protein